MLYAVAGQGKSCMCHICLKLYLLCYFLYLKSGEKRVMYWWHLKSEVWFPEVAMEWLLERWVASYSWMLSEYSILYSIFLYESNPETLLAVVKQILLDLENPFLVSEKHCHLQITGEEDQHKVVPVDYILEKILYLSGNPNRACITSSKFLQTLLLSCSYEAIFYHFNITMIFL